MTTTTSTPSLLTAFEADGCAAPLRVHDARAADRVREQFDALEPGEGPERAQIGLLVRPSGQRFVWELATHPTILDYVSAVLGPDVMLLATHFFCKYPAPEEAGGQPERFVAWHQDVT